MSGICSVLTYFASELSAGRGLAGLDQRLHSIQSPCLWPAKLVKQTRTSTRSLGELYCEVKLCLLASSYPKQSEHR
jgi:hypothetical protein